MFALLWIVYGMMILAALILGFVLWRGKGSFLIAGYNTAKPWEKTKYDEKALCRSVAVILFALVPCFVVSALSIMVQEILPPWTGIVLILVVVIVGMVYINTSKNVKRK